MERFLSPIRQTQVFEAVSPPQLLLLVLSLHPSNCSTFGFKNKKRIINWLNRMAHVVVILFASLGFRIGELLPPRLGSRVPLPIAQQNRILCLSNITLTDQYGLFDSVTLLPTIYQQITFLKRAMADKDTKLGLIALNTKNKKDRVVGISHCHIFDSCILCPICALCTYLLHRIGCFNKRLIASDHLFVLLAKEKEILFPSTTFRESISRVCKLNTFYPVHPHDFKRGILT